MQNISVDNLVRQEYPEMIKERLYSIESQEKASDNQSVIEKTPDYSIKLRANAN
jgi:hypothetical protein